MKNISVKTTEKTSDDDRRKLNAGVPSFVILREPLATEEPFLTEREKPAAKEYLYEIDNKQAVRKHGQQKFAGSSMLGVDFIRVILSDVPDERFAYFPALAKRGKADRGTEHKHKLSNQLALPITKTAFLWNQRGRRGRASPFGGT
ncbi:MAG: hypothetical protein R6V39_11560 [Desulfovibrionales bacterium]